MPCFCLAYLASELETEVQLHIGFLSCNIHSTSKGLTKASCAGGPSCCLPIIQEMWALCFLRLVSIVASKSSCEVTMMCFAKMLSIWLNCWHMLWHMLLHGFSLVVTPSTQLQTSRKSTHYGRKISLDGSYICRG